MKSGIGMLAMASLALAASGESCRMEGRGKVGSGKNPNYPVPIPLKRQDFTITTIPKGHMKEKVEFVVTTEKYIVKASGDITYTSNKRRLQRINSLEREISIYIQKVGISNLKEWNQFEITPLLTTQQEGIKH